MTRVIAILFDVVKTPSFLIFYIAAIILGIILAIKNGFNEKNRLVTGSLVPLAVIVLDTILLTWGGVHPELGKYVILKMAIYIIQLISLVVMYSIYAKYQPSNWVISIFVVVSVIYLAYSYYVYQAVYNLGGLFNNKSVLLKSLGKFFNNTKGLKFTGFACTYIPLIAVAIDGYLKNKVINKELNRK